MMKNHYAERDVMELDELGNHYSNHVHAMTAENLHNKMDIAAELGRRDVEIERLQGYKAAYDEWIVKTQWVQDTLQPLELGLHRADALRDRIQKLGEEHDQLKAQINGMKQAIDELIEHSFGVTGLHLNGEVAEWSDLRGEGRFCEWLAVFDDTPEHSLAAHDAEVIERIASEVDRLGEGVQVVSVNSRWLRDYANQLRQQDTEEIE